MTLTFARAEWIKRQLPKPSIAISDYMTPQEIARLKAAMMQRWKDIGADYHGKELRYRRDTIHQAIARIKKGKVPLLTEDATEDLLAGLRARYEEVKAKAYDAIASDNALWSRELERRAELEAKYGREENEPNIGAGLRHRAPDARNSEIPRKSYEG